MAAEVDLQMQKMQSLKVLLEVHIREARREEGEKMQQHDGYDLGRAPENQESKCTTLSMLLRFR